MANALASTLILLGANILAGAVAHIAFDKLLFGSILTGSASAFYCRSIWVAFLVAAYLFFTILMSFGTAEENGKARRGLFLFWAGTGVWFLWGLAFHRSTLAPLLSADAAAFFIFANAAAGAFAQKHAIGALACWERFKADHCGREASLEAFEAGLSGAAQEAAKKRQGA